MDQILQQITILVASPTGNLFYHLILLFAITATLQTILITQSDGRKTGIQRTLFGLGLLMFFQLLLLVCSGLAWQGVINAHLILPLIDRGFITLGLIWIVWMWAAPVKSRLEDALAGVFSLLVVVYLIYSMMVWSTQIASLSFNGTWLDFGWELFSLAVVIVGMLLLTVKRPNSWYLGLGILVINLAGIALHFISDAPDSDFSGAIRMAQLITYPVLPALARRVFTAQAVSAVQKVPPEAKRKFLAEPKVTYAWLQLALDAESERVGKSLTKAVAQTMLADLCYLITPPDEFGQMSLRDGYDLIREEEMPEIILSESQIYSLGNAIRHGKPLLSPPSVSKEEMQVLSDAIGIKETGNMLFIPLVIAQQVWGGIMLISPYSGRTWNNEDQAYLSVASESMTRILVRAVSQPAEAPDQNSAQLVEARARVQQLSELNQALSDELAALQRPGGMDSDLASLLVMQQESQELVANLQNENERLQKAAAEAKAPATPDAAQLEEELRVTLKEVARLQNILADADIKFLALQTELDQEEPEIEEQKEVVASLVQDLRQPMASIVGYTDLMISEAAGSVGALQRQFLDRIKSSAERMHSLLDELIQVAALHRERTRPEPDLVDMSEIIDQAVMDTSAQIREKNINLHLDLPEELPKMVGDPDAVQQIINELLNNACSATPTEGNVSLTAEFEAGDPEHSSLLVSVTDSGGGISVEDIPQVFSRRYRADAPLILGLGDTGIGLSIAKALVEAHGGKIWVDSDPGNSSTFNILLPIVLPVDGDTNPEK